MQKLLTLLLATSLLACNNSQLEADAQQADTKIQKAQVKEAHVKEAQVLEKDAAQANTAVVTDGKKTHSSLPVSTVKKNTLRQPLTHTHTYKSPGKPSNKLEMDYAVSKERVRVGESVDVSIAFAHANAGSVNARIDVSPGIVMQGDKSIQLRKTKANGRHDFKVTPTTEGIHYVNIFAGNEQLKPFAIRIVAGDKPIKDYLIKNGETVKTNTGEVVISMPADEY